MTQPARFYRAKAAEMREVAGRAPDEAKRVKFAEIADQYGGLAEQAEAEPQAAAEPAAVPH
jgi:hypothetical protein